MLKPIAYSWQKTESSAVILSAGVARVSVEAACAVASAKAQNVNSERALRPRMPTSRKARSFLSNGQSANGGVSDEFDVQ